MSIVFQKSFEDIFSKEVLLFVLIIGLLSAFTAGLFIWYTWEGISSFIVSYLGWIPWEWLQTSGADVITFAVGYVLFTVMVGIFTSLFSEALLIKLAKKHYPIIPVVATPSITKSLILTLKASAIFLLLFMLFFYLIFIPILGQVFLLYLWSILLREPTLYDVGTLFITDKNTLKRKGKKTRVLAMIASLFNYIPLLNLFAPIFSQILFLHHILGTSQDA
ncbi:Probable transmembrane protein [hydrothermal vent metagenome]|uniref:Probable transmembrane protein n=1 Tax=hydrothermal vent metagenome TaxID=652676 RepID=A0A1W1CCL6_9ZZZZ